MAAATQKPKTRQSENLRTIFGAKHLRMCFLCFWIVIFMIKRILSFKEQVVKRATQKNITGRAGFQQRVQISDPCLRRCSGGWVQFPDAASKQDKPAGVPYPQACPPARRMPRRPAPHSAGTACRPPLLGNHPPPPHGLHGKARWGDRPGGQEAHHTTSHEKNSAVKVVP